jgi:integrase
MLVPTWYPRYHRAMSSAIPAPSLVVREHNGQPFYEAKFRHGGRQVKRRVGPAWLEQQHGAWQPRKGRVTDGYYDERRAHVRAAELATEHVHAVNEAADAQAEQRGAGLTFRYLARDYLDWLASVKGAKPATLRDHRLLLAGVPSDESQLARHDGEIMRALGDQPASAITTKHVRDLLGSIAARGVSPRTVNKHRNLIGAIFSYGVRERDVPDNPVVGIQRRREPNRAALLYYQPHEIEAIADALASGQHREVHEHHARGCTKGNGGTCHCTPTFRARGQEFPDLDQALKHHRSNRDPDELLEDQQSAEAVRVAAYAGLRLGELLALRWRDVDLPGAALTISRAISARIEGPTKSGEIRRVPMADQTRQALARLNQRNNFTSPDDLVFSNALGRPLDGSALRRRYKRARDAAALRPLRWHDLRHTFGSLLIAGGVDIVSVKDALGHSQLSTTSRYLHARPANERAAAFTAAFTP